VLYGQLLQRMARGLPGAQPEGLFGLFLAKAGSDCMTLKGSSMLFCSEIIFLLQK
jgi:hypothetical protein